MKGFNNISSLETAHVLDNFMLIHEFDANARPILTVPYKSRLCSQCIEDSYSLPSRQNQTWV
jgi:hypothetical protein